MTRKRFRFRRWSLKRRIRKLRRSRLAVMTLFTMLAAAATTAVIVSIPKDQSLRQARLALTHRKPELAIRVLAPFLAEHPYHIGALCVHAKALMLLRRMQPARESLDTAVAVGAAGAEPHELLVEWAVRHMHDALKQPDFSTRPELQSRFDGSMSLGLAHCRWLRERKDPRKQIVGRLLEARLVLADLRRLQSLRHALGQSPVRLASTGPRGKWRDDETQGDGDAQRLTRRMESRRTELKSHLQAVLDADPDRFTAWDMYVDLASSREGEPFLWGAAEQLSRRPDVPSRLAAKTASSLLTAGNAALPIQRRVEAGWQVLLAVNPDHRETVDWRLAAARLHLAGGQPERAQPLLERILERRPDHVQARHLLAKSLFDQELYSAAGKILDGLCREPAPSAQLELLYGLTLLKTGKTDLAVEALRRAIQIDPGGHAAHWMLWRLLSEQGRITEVARDIRDYADAHPRNPFAIRMILLLERALDDRGAIEDLMRQVATYSPLSNDHLAVLIDGYLYLRDSTKSLQFARALIKRRPRHIEGYLGSAAAMLARGHYARALHELADLWEKFPNDLRVTELQGRCHLLDGRYGRAANLFQKVVDTQPANYKAGILLAESLSRLGLADDAVEQAERVLEQHPQSMAVHRMVARVYELSGRADKTDECLARLDETRLDENRYPVLLARAKLAKGDPERAAAIAERALLAGNANPLLRTLLARIAIEKNLFNQAEFHMLALVRGQPDDPQRFALLARFYFESGRIDEGLSKLQDLESANESLARISRASILRLAGRSDEALALYNPLYESLIAEGDTLALTVADAIAGIQAAGGKPTAAQEVYDKMITAGVSAPQAALRQVDLAVTTGFPGDSVGTLDGLAVELEGGRPTLRFEFMRRYVALGRHDRALALLEAWIETHPDSTPLLRAKAELLVEAGRRGEAIDIYRRLVDRDGGTAMTWRRLAGLLVSQFDFPAAKAAFETLGRKDHDAERLSLVGLGQMWMDLGLHGQARLVLARMASLPMPRDPNVLLTLGQLSAALNLDEAALPYLLAIPETAPEFTVAQSLVVRVDERSGPTGQARERLGHLLKDRRTAAGTVRELVKLNIHRVGDERILRWADGIIVTGAKSSGGSAATEGTALAGVAFAETIPEDAQRRWLGVHTALAAKDGDWKAVLAALQRLAVLAPPSPTLDAARICVLVHLDRMEQARELFHAGPELSNSDMAVLARVVVGESPDGRNPPQVGSQWESAALRLAHARAVGDLLAAGEPDGYKAAARQIIEASAISQPAARTAFDRAPVTVFGSDLLKGVVAVGPRPESAGGRLRDLALAYLARLVALPELCTAVTSRMIRDGSQSPLAYALHAQSLLDRNLSDELARAERSIDRVLPGSNLSLYLSARRNDAGGDPVGAVEDLRRILRREPANFHVRYLTAQLLIRSGRIDEAISALEELVAQSSAKRAVATHTDVNGVERVTMGIGAAPAAPANDLAWLLAEHYPERWDEAHRLASQALEADSRSVQVRDTLGWIEHLRGDDKKALMHLSLGLSRTNTPPEVHSRVAAVYESLGNPTWAKYHVEAASQAGAPNADAGRERSRRRPR